jgi:hypothetical protein
MEKEIIGWKLTSNAPSPTKVAELIGSSETIYDNGCFFLKKHESGSMVQIAKGLGIWEIWFEPVYKKDATFTMVVGSNKKPITVDTIGIQIDGTPIVSISKVKELYKHMRAIDSITVGPFSCTPSVRIGCISESNTFNIHDFEKVLDAHESLL